MLDAGPDGRTNNDYSSSDITPELRRIADESAATREAVRDEVAARYPDMDPETREWVVQERLAGAGEAGLPGIYNAAALRRVDSFRDEADAENIDRDKRIEAGIDVRTPAQKRQWLSQEGIDTSRMSDDELFIVVGTLEEYKKDIAKLLSDAEITADDIEVLLFHRARVNSLPRLNSNPDAPTS